MLFRKSKAVPLVLLSGVLLFFGYGCYQGWWDGGQGGGGGRGVGNVGGGGRRWFTRGPRVFVPMPIGGGRRPTGVPSSPRGGFGKTGIGGIGA